MLVETSFQISFRFHIKRSAKKKNHPVHKFSRRIARKLFKNVIEGEMLSYILFGLTLVAASKVAQDFIPHSYFSGWLQTCSPNSSAVISSAEMFFSSERDPSSGMICMAYNQQMKFLPVQIYESFFNLVELVSHKLGIGARLKNNLKELIFVELGGCRITDVADDD